jgi:steroid delta-isomerase-like uncharacterized protein
MTMNYHALSFRIITVLLFFFWHLTSFAQHTSLEKANKKTIIRYFEEVVNTQKLNSMGQFFSRDYIWHQMNGTDVRSSQDSSHVSMLRFIYTAIPDLHYTIDNAIVEGDMVAVNSTVTGTARSEMFGLPAAQKKVRFKQMFFFLLTNNKITEEWEVVDGDGLKAQLAKQ